MKSVKIYKSTEIENIASNFTNNRLKMLIIHGRYDKDCFEEINECVSTNQS